MSYSTSGSRPISHQGSYSLFVRPQAAWVAAGCAVTGAILSSLYYLGISSGNPGSWIFWLLSMAMILYAVLPGHHGSVKQLSSVRGEFILGILVAVLFLVSHRIGAADTPWNQYGLFDDAAWDIYFARSHVFVSPFQAAYFDTVGYISREVLFHYYITVFFLIFGYNLAAFNIALLGLGLVTVVFTTLTIQRIFRNSVITVLSALIINWFPLHYMHIFMGHRYAIAPSLLSLSLYFLFVSYSSGSAVAALVSGIMAAFCFSGSVMGKQLLLALAASAMTAAFLRRFRFGRKERRLVALWIMGFTVGVMPMASYMVWNGSVYAVRESGLLSEFMHAVFQDGLDGVVPYSRNLYDVFFSDFTYRRQFLTGFPVIPPAYFLLILPGLGAALWKRRFEIIFISLIPVAAAFVSGAYDFRVLFAVPGWVISMAYGMDFVGNAVARMTQGHAIRISRAARIIIPTLVVSFGFIPSWQYIRTVASDPNSQYLLPHRDVAVSRVLQDIAAGSRAPTHEMKRDEFDRRPAVLPVPYDTFACPFGAYAIAHLYLQQFDDRSILSFCNQGIQLLMTPEEITRYNIRAVSEYAGSGKALKMVWELSEKSAQAIELFRTFVRYGSERYYTGAVDGNRYALYELTIEPEHIRAFQDEVRALVPKTVY